MMRKALATILVYMFAAVSSNAQVWKKTIGNSVRVKNFAFKTYTINDGLPSKNTTSALKDKRGFMWIGTENGLCKFDGYTFKTFVNSSDDSTTLSNNFVTALIETKEGKIWVGTLDGLNLFDPITEKFKRFYHNDKQSSSLSNNKVWALLADREGTVWVGTDDGFNRYIERSGRFKTYQPDLNNPYAIKGKSVNSIIEDKYGNLWLGNWSCGLNKFLKKSQRFINYQQKQLPGQKNPNDIWYISYSENGKIWVGTYWKGLFLFNPVTNTFKAFPASDLENTGVYSVMEASKNTLLVGGNSGFYFVDTKKNDWQKINDVTNATYGDSFKDQDGILWICSRNGVTKIDHNRYKFDILPLDLKHREVKSLLVSDSTIWLGTNNGLYKFDYLTGSTKLYSADGKPQSLRNDDISKLYIDSKKNLWVLTENGFNRYNVTTDKFIHYSHHSKLGSLYNEDVFRDILEVSPGEFWLATDAGVKIFNMNNGKFTHYYNDKHNPFSISNNHVYCFIKDGLNIWVGTNGGGLNRFERNTHKFYTYNANGPVKKISNNIINDLKKDLDGNIWVCTADGLNRYNQKTDSFETFSKKDGFANNLFSKAVQARNGELWITTETGLSKFNYKTREVRNFDDADGVYVNSTIAQASNGEIYLAGKTGILYFDPAKIKYNTIPPSIYISDFQVFNKSIEQAHGTPLQQMLNSSKAITLKYDQSVFSIEYVALNFSHSDKNQYSYKLIGFDKKWNYVKGERKATYTNLNPGTYTFWVKASNNDGVWNNAGRKLTIVITPPWYLTWWAYCGYACILILISYTYILYRDRQARLKYEIKLAHIEGEKEKELNEKKLTFFTNVSHEFRTPLTLIINPLKEILYNYDKNIDISSLNIVYRNAKRLLSLVDQLLLFRKADSEKDGLKISRMNLVSLAREVFLCFSHQAKVKNITFKFDCDSDFLEIFADREKIEVVFFNLLSNALKFTPENGEIRFCIAEYDDRVVVEVADSGCGISKEAGDRLFDRFHQESGNLSSLRGGFGIGLYLVKTFIERHGGSVDYISKLKKGTTFYVNLLKGKKHLQVEEVLEDAEISSDFLKELIEDEITSNSIVEAATDPLTNEKIASDVKSLLIIDDNQDIREYITQIFRLEYTIYEADNGQAGYALVKEVVPDIVISDVMMQGMSGIELCNLIKDDQAISHIPVILLTASSSPEIKLKGIEGGADDYISKPFDKELLKARVSGILKSKNNLQKYFYNEITLNTNTLKISADYKNFLENCISIVEKHITEPDFNIQTLATEIGMSRSNLFKKIKSISGLSSNSFIRFIRLRKAAEIFINTDNTILETSYLVGISDPKYFREQFNKLFNMNPSQYIKKYRKTFSSTLNIHADLRRSGKR